MRLLMLIAILYHQAVWFGCATLEVLQKKFIICALGPLVLILP
jgi:hypothetical protein